ncbi:MAG: hypothetical protein WDA18_09645 [Candidatus Ratteibacteria bacterium]
MTNLISLNKESLKVKSLKAKETLAKSLRNMRSGVGSHKELAKEIGTTYAAALGGIQFLSGLIGAATSFGVLATGFAATSILGFEALTIKIADKYFRKQLLNNTMNEAAEKAYKAACLGIRSLLEQGKSEEEVIRILGEMDGPTTEWFVKAHVAAVNKAEKAGAYKK